MPTPFKFENVFRAPSVADVLAAYFDPDHLATQDKVAELTDRVVTEQIEGEGTLKCTWKVGSLRSLPIFVRPFVRKELVTSAMLPPISLDTQIGVRVRERLW